MSGHDNINDCHDHIKSSGISRRTTQTAGEIASSWSYEDKKEPAEERPTPPEVVETLEHHDEDGDRYQAAISGDYKPHFADPVKGTAYLVRGIKKATHETGSRPPGVMETLSFIAQTWPTDQWGQPRWWTRDDQSKFREARQFVFSEQTDPETFFEAPDGAEKRWRQQAEQASRHEAQVRSAFWKCIRDAKGGIVFARHSDVAAHRSVEVGPEQTKNILSDWSAVEKVDDPHYDGNGFQRKVFAVKDK